LPRSVYKVPEPVSTHHLLSSVSISTDKHDKTIDKQA
jgi:hypothetical protein